MENLARVRAVLFLTLGLNLVVSAVKLTAGYFFHSVSMMADGFHSFFDATSNIIGLVGVKVANKPPDESHPYGHKKYETFAALGIAALLFGTCLEVLKRAYAQLAGGPSAIEVTYASFAVMIATMCVNIFVATYEAKKGRELKSDFLMADAGHTKSDIFATTAVIASLAGVKLGFPMADPIAAVVIAILIGRVGYEIMKSSSDILCDAARVRSDQIVALCMSVPRVIKCHHVRSRGREDAVCVDLRVHVAPDLTTSEAHEIAHQVEDTIRNGVPGVTDVMVHIEPEE